MDLPALPGPRPSKPAIGNTVLGFLAAAHTFLRWLSGVFLLASFTLLSVVFLYFILRISIRLINAINRL